MRKYLPTTNEVWGKVIFLHLSVILFTGVWCLPHCMLGYTRPQAFNPQADTTRVDPPPRQTSPWADAPRMLQDMVNKRAVRILLKCILVKNWDTKRLLKKFYMWLFFFFSCNGKLILRIVLLWYIDLQFIVGELRRLIDHVLGFLVHTLFLVALVLCKSDWPPETSVILANWSFYHA